MRARFATVQFGLLGFVDVENPAAIPRAQIAAWQAEGVVEYFDATDDVRPRLAETDCVVLPSYREGTPRSLLEAAAMGIPVIASDAVGCREVVDDGVTGLLCRVKDASDLAEKMIRMVNLSLPARSEMGRRGREKMVREFDQALVVRAYLDNVSLVFADNSV